MMPSCIAEHKMHTRLEVSTQLTYCISAVSWNIGAAEEETYFPAASGLFARAKSILTPVLLAKSFSMNHTIMSC